MDWLRFISAFGVLVSHARFANWVDYSDLTPDSQNWASGLFYAVCRPGHEAVMVFFVLSGFLVGGKLGERVLNGTFHLGTYIIDRISRIYVPLIPALAVSAGVIWFDGGSVSFKEFLGNLLGLQELVCDNFADNEPLWSLAYELWFYVLGGAVASLLSVGRGGKLGSIVVILVGFGVFTRLEAWMLFVWCFGALAYGMLGRTPQRGWMGIGLVLAAAGFMASQISSRHIVPHGSDPDHGQFQVIAFSRLAMAAGVAMFVSSVAAKRPSSQWALSFEGWGSRLASFSYTLYLTHFPILNLFKHVLRSKFTTLGPFSFACFVGELAVCLLVAWVLYLLFEKQTGRVRQWLRDRFVGA